MKSVMHPSFHNLKPPKGFVQDSFNASSNLSLDSLNMTIKQKDMFKSGSIPIVEDNNEFEYVVR